MWNFLCGQPAAGAANGARGTTVEKSRAKKRPKFMTDPVPPVPPPPWKALNYFLKAIDMSLPRAQIEKSTPGFRWLDDETHSFIILVPDALKVNKQAFNDFWAVGQTLEPTPNPYNSQLQLKRRQGTYGSTYPFAGQTSKQIGGDDESKWPDPVRRVLADARGRCTLPGSAIVHCNFYPADAFVSPHVDDGFIIKGSPIFSYTFVRECPRSFQIYNKKEHDAKKDKCPVHREYILTDGTLLIMGGTMQSHYKHGVKKITGVADIQKWSTSQRINMTVRFLAPKQAPKHMGR